MSADLIHVGFGNHLATNHVIAVASPNSAPIRRVIQDTKGKGMVIDMTSGRRTKSVMFMDDGHIILAAITPETIAARATGRRAAAHREPSEAVAGAPA
ncbi:MAG: DUF370 domain-containing protein [Dehalococcoidia bacterium]|nr:DUF370 domain-containing protein [Dehalococcoidia bacterium]